MSASVQQIMRRDFIRADADESLESVRQTMRLAKLRHLPVMRGDELIGIVSYRDLIERLLDRSNRSDTSLDRAVLRPPLCVAPETPLRDAADSMCRYGLGCLPVVKSDELVGLITEIDLLRAAYQLPGLSPL